MPLSVALHLTSDSSASELCRLKLYSVQNINLQRAYCALHIVFSHNSYRPMMAELNIA